ncbi:MATE efflux family protein [Clostridium sp. DL-VIII]|uniref:MATE efflux family protein n=1 Tax=Clostridium sp. DL-VIII TaxID=641107 RepID=UPI00023B00CD|nr:MATE efflux family protein [Clostridium sp. DL-VIII]EHI99182.1 MATE efflux family protein [Clostridium sp. DL-VIII]
MTRNMSEVNPIKILIGFTIPMILENIFQQIYNTTYAIIVGKYIGENDLYDNQ